MALIAYGVLANPDRIEKQVIFVLVLFERGNLLFRSEFHKNSEMLIMIFFSFELKLAEPSDSGNL